MKGFVGTVVGGAIGVVALYLVGKVAFQAGYEIASAEHRYKELTKKPEVAKEPEETATEEVTEPEKKRSLLGTFLGMRRSPIGNLFRNPENHVIEASIRGREIHVNVKPKRGNGE